MANFSYEIKTLISIFSGRLWRRIKSVWIRANGRKQWRYTIQGKSIRPTFHVMLIVDFDRYKLHITDYIDIWSLIPFKGLPEMADKKKVQKENKGIIGGGKCIYSYMYLFLISFSYLFFIHGYFYFDIPLCFIYPFLHSFIYSMNHLFTHLIEISYFFL